MIEERDERYGGSVKAWDDAKSVWKIAWRKCRSSETIGEWKREIDKDDLREN